MASAASFARLAPGCEPVLTGQYLGASQRQAMAPRKVRGSATVGRSRRSPADHSPSTRPGGSLTLRAYATASLICGDGSICVAPRLA